MRRIALSSLLLCACLTAQTAPSDLAPSIITLPICIDLAPVFQSAERNAPKTPPGVETWMPLPGKPGTTYRFNLYRDPLAFHLNHNRISVRTTAHYWLEIGLKAGPLVKSVASCGLGQEGFRRILLGTSAEIQVKPDWRIDLKATLDEPMAANPCEITFLNFDITNNVLSGMKDNLLKATTAMEQQVRNSVMLQQQAESMWKHIQHPFELSKGIWMSLNPECVRMAPWRSQGKVLTLTPQIQARPRITLGPPPIQHIQPLPRLETCEANINPDFKIQIETELGFEHATQQLQTQMRGKRFETDKGTFEVVDIALSGLPEKGMALICIDLKGKVNGKLSLAGRPVFNEADGKLQFQNLDYTLESKSWITSFGEWLFRSTLRKTLSEKANLFMDQSFKDIQDLAQKGLNRPLAQGIRLSGKLDTFKLGEAVVLKDRFRMPAFLGGQMRIDVDALGAMGK